MPINVGLRGLPWQEMPARRTLDHAAGVPPASLPNGATRAEPRSRQLKLDGQTEERAPAQHAAWWTTYRAIATQAPRGSAQHHARAPATPAWSSEPAPRINPTRRSPQRHDRTGTRLPDDCRRHAEVPPGAQPVLEAYATRLLAGRVIRRRCVVRRRWVVRRRRVIDRRRVVDGWRINVRHSNEDATAPAAAAIPAAAVPTAIPAAAAVPASTTTTVPAATATAVPPTTPATATAVLRVSRRGSGQRQCEGTSQGYDTNCRSKDCTHGVTLHWTKPTYG